MSFIKFVLRVAITAFIAGACGASAWLYYATHYLEQERSRDVLPAPQATGENWAHLGGAGLNGPLADKAKDGKPLSLLESIIGKKSLSEPQEKEGPLVPGYITTDTSAYLTEGEGMWGRLKKNTSVYVPDGDRFSPWAKVYYPQEGKNIVLYVSIHSVKKGSLSATPAIPKPAEIPEDVLAETPEPSPAQTNSNAHCQDASLASGSILKGAPKGENTFVVSSRDKDTIIQVQSLTEGISMYVAAGRTETFKAPPGYYTVSFLMGKNFTDCGSFREEQEAKRDKAGVDLAADTGPKTVRYDMSSGGEGGDFVVLSPGEF